MRTASIILLVLLIAVLLAGCPPAIMAQGLGSFMADSQSVLVAPVLTIHQAAPIIPGVPAAPSKWSVGLVQGGVPLGETGGCVSYMVRDAIVCKFFADAGIVRDQDASAYLGFLGVSTDLQFVPVLSQLLGKLPGGGKAGIGHDWGANRGRWFGYCVLTSTQF